MSINYSPELVTDGVVFVGDARTSSTATAGSRLYNQAGVDSTAVKLLIHGNVGSDQNFTDSSLSNHTVTAYGDVTHSTTQSKFSGGSIYFDGSGDYLTIPASGDWDVGTGDWTLDCWAYTTLGTSYSYLFDTRDGSNTSNFSIYRYGLTLVYYAQVTSKITTGNVLTLNTWHHIALVRSGSTVTLYVDGTSAGSATDASDYQGLAPFLIGSRYSLDTLWQGYQDEFRFTKGTALWTQDFNPPARRDTLSISDGMMYNGTCVNFDGTDEQVYTGDGPGVGFGALSANDDVTLCAWINVDTSGDMGVVSIGNVFMSIIVNGGYLEARCYNSGSQLTNTDAHKITPNQWCHVAGVFSGGNVTLYKDGVATAAVACSNQSLAAASAYFQIGKGYTSGYLWMDGEIASPMAFDTALSASQIKEIYQDSKVIIPSNVSQTNLRGWWTFADGAGTICYDGSGRGIHGEFQNMESADWSTGQTGCPQLVEGYNRPMLFDGSDDWVDCGSSPITSNSAFSWAAWINPTGSSGTPFFLGTNVAGEAMVAYWDSSTGMVRLGVWGADKLISNIAIPVNSWGHTCWTWDGTTLRAYTNGVAAGTATPAAFNIASDDMIIGAAAASAQEFEGLINEVIVYDTALTLAQVQALAATGPNGGPLPPDPMSLSNSSDIAAYWRNDGDVTWKNRAPGVVKNFTDVATDPINDTNSVGNGVHREGWTHNGTSLNSVTGGRTGFIDGAMRVAPRYRFLFNSAINCTVNSVIAVTSGKTYKLSAWFMGGTSTTARLIATGGYYDSGNFTAASTSWTNKTDTFTATSTGDLTIELHNRAAGTMYFDDVTLVESGPALDGTVYGSPDALLFKQGYNGRLSTSTGRDGQGFPLKCKDVGAVGFSTGNYINIPQSDDNFKFGTGDFAIACWFLCADFSNSDGGRYDRVFMLGDAFNANSISVNIETGGMLQFRWNDAVISETYPISINQWFYFVATRRDGILYLYLNGDLQDSDAFTTNVDNAGDYAFTLGSERDAAGTSSLHGSMSGAQVYNRGLSQAEITQNMNAQRSRFE